MPLTTQINGSGPALPAKHLSADAGREVSNAIGQVNAGNLFGSLGTIPGLNDIYGWRVDRQNAAAGFVNISVQRNHVAAPSTVASVFVPAVYNLAPPTAQAGAAERTAYAARLKELERVVRRALEESFASYTANTPQATAAISRYVLQGNFSA